MTSVDAAPHPAPPEHSERPEGVGARAEDRPGWNPWTALAVLLVGFLAASVAGLAIVLVAIAGGASSDDLPGGAKIASIVAQDVCLVGTAFAFARIAGAPRPAHFGLRRPRTALKVAVALALGCYAAFIVLSGIWLAILGETEQKDTIVKDLGADGSTVALIVVALLITVAAPIVEEFFFRGYIFGALRPIGLAPAAALTGVAFGLVHIAGSPLAFILPLAVFGGLLCLVRERTGSLYPCIAAHALNNSIAFSASQHWDWQVPVLLAATATLIVGLLRAGVSAWPALPSARGSSTA